MIRPQQMNLRDAAACVIARGLVPIDSAEGPPGVITWEGDIFVIAGWCVDGSLDYRKTRVMHAGANFEAVR